MANNRVVLILVDGMRPDGMVQAHTPNMDKIMANGQFSLKAKTVMPSVTLPVHMSLFHSVKPDRHNNLTNTYAPQVRPIPGLMDVIHQHDKSGAMFYNWEQLRDLSRPGSLAASVYFAVNGAGIGESDLEITSQAIDWLSSHDCHLAFLYLGQTDEVGHRSGWMSPEYIEAIQEADVCIGQVMDALGGQVHYIVTADHGGHDNMHGTPLKVDMKIPMLMSGPKIAARGKIEGKVSILDIAPTITKILKVKAPKEWRGKSLL